MCVRFDFESGTTLLSIEMGVDVLPFSCIVYTVTSNGHWSALRFPAVSYKLSDIKCMHEAHATGRHSEVPMRSEAGPRVDCTTG